MTIAFMVTDGGPHPPEKWADISAAQIMSMIQIAPTADPSAMIAKRELELALFKVLRRLHEQNQEIERETLKKRGASYLQTPLDVVLRVIVKTAVTEVVNAARGSPFAAHFEKPEVQAHIYNIVGQHFTDAADIERKWYADRNPK
jgi:hypothetical protein